MKTDWQNKQKEFINQQFAKLTKQFLTESERKLVSVDFNLVDWKKMNLNVWGLTRYNTKSGIMKVSFRYHADYDELLDTIAHEFAHVYLNLRDTIYHSCQESKHIAYTAYFFRYLEKL